MRTLFILRGLPGCGKSTFIKENNLEAYTVSSDAIRLLFSSPQLNKNGDIVIPGDSDKFVWTTLFNVVENRMKNGDFTIIDATHAKGGDIAKYKPLVEKYRYRTYCVDFTDISLEEVKRRNSGREKMRVVPESVIDRMNESIKSTSVPSFATVISPEEAIEMLKPEYSLKFTKNFNQYKKINIYGDIHGCYSALMKAIGNEGIKDDECYIFLGDYLDRGPENTKTLQFFLEIFEKENVFCLEGNHEAHLRKWCNDERAFSREFESVTKEELEAAGIDKKSVRQFCRKLGQCLFFEYNYRKYFVSHGGISNFISPILIPTKQLIKGVEGYEECEDVENAFYKNSPEIIQIHGHRNVHNLPIHPVDNCYNLEGAVEFGQYFRYLVLEKCGADAICIKNDDIVIRNFEDNLPPSASFQSERLDNMEVKHLLQLLKTNPMIIEKKFGNISSFNFSRKAFEKGTWSSQTVKARGLFIDTLSATIVARSYDKFFRINEMSETTIESLKEYLQFPVTVYNKENGFLGMLSGYMGKPLFATKSSLVGDYCEYFKNVLFHQYGEVKINEIAKYAEKHNCTFVFECIDTKNDPHIIKYDSDAAILLDIIFNENKFRKLDYESLKSVGEQFGVKIKTVAKTIANWDEFVAFYNSVENKKPEFTATESDIEGYVMEDANGFMVKLKTQFYNYWKMARGLTNTVISGKSIKRFEDIPKPLQRYLRWIKEKIDEGEILNGDKIIALRERFFAEC